MSEYNDIVSVSFTEDNIAVIKMTAGDNKINNEFLTAFNECLDKVEE